MRLKHAGLREGSLKGVNLFALRWKAGYGRAVRIGDAAAIIPPLTGNGMAMALQGALRAWSEVRQNWAQTERAVVSL